MLTSEGADDAEIIVRPSADGRWQVEIPTRQGVSITSVDDEREAFALARALRPDAQIRVLPAAESAQTLRDDLGPGDGRGRLE